MTQEMKREQKLVIDYAKLLPVLCLNDSSNEERTETYDVFYSPTKISSLKDSGIRKKFKG